MKSFHHKKVYRADTEGVRKLTRSAQRKLTVTCIAIGAVALILLGAGLEYLNANNTGSGRVSYEKLEKNLTGQMREEMAEASSYLEKLDGSVTKNQKTLDEVNQQLTKREESLLEVETTQKKMEENASETSVRVTELEKRAETQVETLKKDMDFIHTDIRSAMEKISTVMQALERAELEGEAGRVQSGEEIARMNEAVTEIGKSIQTVETNLQESYQSLDILLRELQKNGESNQSEYVRKLSDVERSMKELLETDMVHISDTFLGITEGLQEKVLELDQNMSGNLVALGQSLNGNFAELGQSLDGNFAGLGQSLDGSLAELEQGVTGSFAELGVNLDGKFQQMNTSILMQFAELLASDGNNRDALIDAMDALRNTLEEELNQVFTSVSNGKRELASALLTKGVTTSADATFAQLKDAILSIDQKLVLGVQEIPGTISYEYHYHTDASGAHPHTEKTDTKGGCYTNGVTHVHTGGCYDTTWYHEHTKDCPTHTYLVDWVPEPYWARDYTCNDVPLNATSSVLRCGKGSGTVEYYAPSCGLSEGQIVSAHIVYVQGESGNSNATPMTATGGMESLKSGSIKQAEALPAQNPETGESEPDALDTQEPEREEEETRTESGREPEETAETPTEAEKLPEEAGETPVETEELPEEAGETPEKTEELPEESTDTPEETAEEAEKNDKAQETAGEEAKKTDEMQEEATGIA